MAEPFLWSKVFDFSGNTVSKIISFGIKFILIFGAIGGLLWSVYVTIIKPHTNPTPTTSQNAEQLTNYYYYYYPNKKILGVGFTLWGMDIGLTKYDYPTEPTVVKKVTESKNETPIQKPNKKRGYLL